MTWHPNESRERRRRTGSLDHHRGLTQSGITALVLHRLARQAHGVRVLAAPHVRELRGGRTVMHPDQRPTDPDAHRRTVRVRAVRGHRGVLQPDQREADVHQLPIPAHRHRPRRVRGLLVSRADAPRLVAVVGSPWLWRGHSEPGCRAGSTLEAGCRDTHRSAESPTPELQRFGVCGRARLARSRSLVPARRGPRPWRPPSPSRRDRSDGLTGATTGEPPASSPPMTVPTVRSLLEVDGTNDRTAQLPRAAPVTTGHRA